MKITRQVLLSVAAAAVMALLPVAANAEMFSCTEANGTRVLTNMACEEGSVRRPAGQQPVQSYSDAGGVRSYYQSVRIFYVQAAPPAEGVEQSEQQSRRKDQLIRDAVNQERTRLTVENELLLLRPMR